MAASDPLTLLAELAAGGDPRTQHTRVELLARAIEAGQLDSEDRGEGAILELFGIRRFGARSGATAVNCAQFSRLLAALATRPAACNALERPWVELYRTARAAGV